MKERVSEFPDRPTVRRGEEPRAQISIESPTAFPKKRSRGGRGLGRLMVFGFIAYWLYHSGLLEHIPEQAVEVYEQVVETWRSADLPFPKTERPPVSSKPQPLRSTPRKIETAIPRTEAPVVVKPQLIQAAKGGTSLEVSIGVGFRPVGFKIGAVSQNVPFSGRPGSLHRRLPRFKGPSQKYGSLDLANGRRHAFILDTDPKGYQLFVDLNRNGDLTDDGEPLINRGKGRFANVLKLPLDRASGITQLQGDMELWIYTNDQSWRQDALRFYNRTQLAGQLQINGKRYAAYLADNRVIDGNYLNDGISIDVNGDGKIDRRSESLSPGDQITLDGERFSITVVR
jgi:hypothetical protein